MTGEFFLTDSLRDERCAILWQVDPEMGTQQIGVYCWMDDSFKTHWPIFLEDLPKLTEACRAFRATKPGECKVDSL
jgi:hypothetical protein